jgi:hypothetical protein
MKCNTSRTLKYVLSGDKEIKGNDEIKEKLSAIKKGDIVAFKGQLVTVNRDDGWKWVSSTTRNDTMGGACEVVWVTDIRILTDKFNPLP